MRAAYASFGVEYATRFSLPPPLDELAVDEPHAATSGIAASRARAVTSLVFICTLSIEVIGIDRCRIYNKPDGIHDFSAADARDCGRQLPARASKASESARARDAQRAHL